MAVVILVLTLSGTFIYAATISAIARLVSYAATCVALPALRCKDKQYPASFKAPGGVWTAMAALLLSLWLLSNCTIEQARDTAIAAAVGLLIYIVYKLKRRYDAPEIADSSVHI